MIGISSQATSGFFHEGMRLVQSRMDTTRLADRLEELKTHDTFDERDRTFVESASMVFIVLEGPRASDEPTTRVRI
jgi:hypothetical protein